MNPSSNWKRIASGFPRRGQLCGWSSRRNNGLNCAIRSKDDWLAPPVPARGRRAGGDGEQRFGEIETRQTAQPNVGRGQSGIDLDGHVRAAVDGLAENQIDAEVAV